MNFLLTRCQINIGTTMSTPRIIGEESEGRIPLREQDLDLGREGVSGLARNGVRMGVEEVVHYR